MPTILKVQHGNNIRNYPLTLPIINIGRAMDNQIMLDEPEVSPNHARLEWIKDVLHISDLGSTHGTKVNGKNIQPRIKHPLKNNDVISIGTFLLTLQVQDTPMGGTSTTLQDLIIKGHGTITIGRSADNDIVLAHPSISWRHARVIWNEQVSKHLIEDLRSSNGTFVNGHRVIRPLLLQSGNVIQIGPLQLIYKLDKISAIDQSRDLRLDALNLNRFIQSKNLLKNISLSIQPQEFVAIVGASGAGKSTLLHALSGYFPASSGKVLLNGNDLYSNFDAFRNQIGFVPQNNIIHMELTVHEALEYSARLRLPSDTSKLERQKRIDDVLNTLGLLKCKEQPIFSLSGGEQKRLSMGVELLTQPGLFFLDEATSGLDPGTELEIMELLRHLADQGHTVILVTHATKNIEKCHSVVILAKGGYLAYFGPPKEALNYFGVNDFDEIYEKLKAIKPENAADRYLKSSYFQKYLSTKLPKVDPAQIGSTNRSINPGASSKKVSSFSQFLILSKRNLNILFRDKISLILMVLTSPIIAMLDFLFWKRGLFEVGGGDARFALTNLFMASMICCLVGALSSMREIVKESDIYQRERMVILKIVPYVLSKVWLSILVAVYSSLVFILFMELAGGWPPLIAIPSVLLTMFLSTLGGALMGLVISALSPNPNVTPLLLLIVLVPQLLFGGIIPSGQVGQAGNIIGYATTTKWTFESMVKISGMGDDIIEDPCWHVPEQKRDALTDLEKTKECDCMGPNIFKNCKFPGIRKSYVIEVDQPEPSKPTNPGDPPTNPGDPPPRPKDTMNYQLTDSWMKDMDKYSEKIKQYEKDMNAYDSKIRLYQNDMDKWQQTYQNWKEKRSKAIGEAEGTIKAMYNDYENVFKTNTKSNWIILSGMIFIFFIFVLIIQKCKDRR